MKKVSFLLPFLALLWSSVSYADLIITEVMQNPSTISDTDGEWFEIYNSGPSIVDLENYVISDNDSDSHTITGSLIVNPGQYLVLARNGNNLTNGGLNADYVYASFLLANGADEIVIRDDMNNELDRVEWDGGPNWPDPNGASMTFVGATESVDNNVGSNWAAATVSYETNNMGTPGTGPFSVVPEPGSVALLGLGAFLLATVRRLRA